MDRNSLAELREAWAIAVLFGDRARWERAKPLPCWFGRCVPGIDECEGAVEGAHWIKRQSVERKIALQLDLPEFVIRRSWQRDLVAGRLKQAFVDDLVDRGLEYVFLAAWDPRNGVPGCNKHHARSDGHRVDAANELIVWRHEVPAPVEAFCLDWGLETALEDRNPAIGEGV